MKKLLTILTVLSSLLINAQTADFIASPTTICSGGQVQFFDASVGAQSYSWTFAGGSPVTSNQANPLVTYATPGVYDVQLTITNSGNLFIELKVGFITILNNASIALTSPPNSDNQILCVNTPLAEPITYTVIGAQNATFTNLPAGVTGSFVPNDSGVVITINGTPTVSGIFNYSFQTGGTSCNPETATGTITVEELQSLTLQSSAGTDNQIVCENIPLTTITYQAGGGATSASASGLPIGLLNGFAAGIDSISGIPNELGVFNYSIVTSGGACPAVSVNGTIEVVIAPSLTLQTVGLENQIICENNAVSSIEYSFGGGATDATVTGLPAGLSGTTTSGIFAITGTATQSGVFNYTVSTIGGNCVPDIAYGTITVEATHTLSLLSIAGTDNQVICENTPLTTINYQVGGGATSAFVSGLPIGLLNDYLAGLDSISGIPNEFGIFNYTLTTVGDACPSVSLSGMIDVTPATTLLLQLAGSDNQTVCENSNITPIDYLIGGTANDATVIGLPAGISGTLTAGVFSITGNSAITGIFNYTVTTSGGTCDQAVATGTLVIEITPTLALQVLGTNNQIACVNSNIDPINYTIIGDATGADVAGLPAGLNFTVSGNVVTITGNSSVTGNYTYTVTTTGSSCTQAVENGSIQIQNSFIDLTSAAYTNDQLVCVNNPIVLIQYEVGGPVTINDLPTGILSYYTPGVPNTFTIYGTPTSVGTFSYTLQSNNNCGSSLVVGNITVIPAITGNTAGSNTTICEGSEFTFIGSSLTSNNSNYTYLWQQAAAITGPWSPAAGINNQSYYTNTQQIGTANFYRRIVYAGNCSSTSAIVTLTVNLLPTVAALNTTSTICTNDTLIIPGFTATNGVFSWTHDGAGQLLNTTTAAPTYIPVNADNGNTVTLSYVVTSNNVCAPATIEGNYSILVLPNPIAEAGGMANVCVNGPTVDIIGTQASNGAITWTQNGFGSLNDNTLLSPIYTTSLQDSGSVILFTMVVSSTLCAVPLTDTAFFTLNVDDFGANPALNAFAGQDVTINLGQSVQLEATGTAITTWNWSPTAGLSDSTIYNPIATPNATNQYVLTVSNALGCFDLDTIQVTVITDFTLFVPNLFSPNEDGTNDFWEIPGINLFPNSKVTVINREGLEVYSNSNYDNTWDGSYNGDPLPEATYYYHLEIVGSEKIYKGAVSILRSTK